MILINAPSSLPEPKIVPFLIILFSCSLSETPLELPLSMKCKTCTLYFMHTCLRHQMSYFMDIKISMRLHYLTVVQNRIDIGLRSKANMFRSKRTPRPQMYYSAQSVYPSYREEKGGGGGSRHKAYCRQTSVEAGG